MTPPDTPNTLMSHLKSLRQKIGLLFQRGRVIANPLWMQFMRLYTQEKTHLAQILAPQRAKWIDPLWNNLKPIVLPTLTFLWTRTRDWIWRPLIDVAERLAPRQVAQWRAIPEPKRQKIVIWGITLVALLILIAPDRRGALDGQAINDPDIIDLSADPSSADNPVWVLNVMPVEVMPFSESLRVTGKFDFDEQRVARIGSTVTGRVTEILAMPGQEVEQGAVLARINSTELGQAQLAFLKARSANELAARAFDRAKILYKEDVIAKADLQRRQSEAETTGAERRAMADQLRVLGMPAAQIESLGQTGNVNSIAAVTASIPGTVVERRIAQGQVVQPADALFTVSDLSVVWVTAQVPEQESYLLAPGQSMKIEVPALNNRVYEGKLVHVGELVSNDSRTVAARTTIDNPDRQLKPGMLATMLISGTPVDKPVVPASAVIREDGYDHVFVALAENQYKLVIVRLGPESNGVRPVISGLEPGTRIVTEQAYHLNNERKKRLTGG